MKPPRPKKQPVKIKGIVDDLIKQWMSRATHQNLILSSAWQEAAGEKVAAHSQPVMLKGSKLIVLVENSAWMNELTFLREKIKVQVKKSFSNAGIEIEDIVFKIGQVVKKTAELPSDVPPPRE